MHSICIWTKLFQIANPSLFVGNASHTIANTVEWLYTKQFIVTLLYYSTDDTNILFSKMNSYHVNIVIEIPNTISILIHALDNMLNYNQLIILHTAVSSLCMALERLPICSAKFPSNRGIRQFTIKISIDTLKSH